MSVQDLDWYSIKKFGAISGGNAAKNRKAIQDAIDAIPGAGRLYLGYGDFSIDGPIELKSNLWIMGDGEAASKIRQINPSANAFETTDAISVVMEGLSVTGPGSGTGKGIYIAYKSQVSCYSTFRHVWVNGFGDDGICIERAIVTNFEQVVSRSNGGHGFSVLDGTSIDWRTTYALKCIKAGYHLSSLHYSGLTVAAVDACGVGYLIRDCRGITLDGCGAEEIDGVALRIEGTVGVTATNFRNLDNRLGVCLVTGGSRGIKLNTPHEQGPTRSGAYSLQVDTGCQVRVEMPILISPTKLAPNTTVIV